jgi:hypothetical protein
MAGRISRADRSHSKDGKTVERRAVRWCHAPCLLLLGLPLAAQTTTPAQDLPDAPSAVLMAALASQDSAPPCPAKRHRPSALQAGLPKTFCQENPLQPIVTTAVRPLTAEQKGVLAMRDIVDPFNLIVITGGAGLSVAANAHSSYGPGFEGWGRLTGYSLVEDAQGEFFGTFAIPALTREDPRYHRMPNASIKRRILHAVGHTFVTQHDDGSNMPNYATLLTYPISAELSNLYVPGVATNGPATARRIVLGLATDPAGGLIAEFLPDFARHVHVHVIFMQQILNEVATGQPNTM